MMQRSLLAIFFIYFYSSAAIAKEPLTVEDFIKAVSQNNYAIWDKFKDYDKALSHLNWLERKQYEEVQRADQNPSKTSFDTIRRLDQLSFERAYPHLKPALKNKEVYNKFRAYYLMNSYGWVRYKAYLVKSFILKDPLLGPKFTDPTLLGEIWWMEKADLKSNYKTPKEKAKHLRLFHYQTLLNLAVCKSYRPAVWDLIKALRYDKKIALPANLSYILLLRLDPTKSQLVERAAWQKGIDQRLTEAEQNEIKALINDKSNLAKTLKICRKQI